LCWRPSSAAASAAPRRRPDSSRGGRVYEREKCATCHSIEGKGNRRHPLDGVGSRLSPEEIRGWIVAPRDMKPGVKKKAYKLSDEDLAVLVEYIDSLEGDPAP
jgi:cytochrome c2